MNGKKMYKIDFKFLKKSIFKPRFQSSLPLVPAGVVHFSQLHVFVQKAS